MATDADCFMSYFTECVKVRKGNLLYQQTWDMAPVALLLKFQVVEFFNILNFMDGSQTQFLFGLRFYVPVKSYMVMSRRSVHPTTLFPGRA